VTPKPIVQGSQTAVVVGPKGEEIFTDKYGRVKVQFHWDRDGKNDEESSCWIRVGQVSAGRRWGASFWPRIGQEVIVDFLEGDVDQPIIVGSVYNADQMPPYLGEGPDAKHRNDNKLSGWKTNTTKGGQGFNELRFDDTKDKEQVFVHAERNLDVRVKSSSMESVGSSKHVTVGGEKDGQKFGEYRERTFKEKHVIVDGSLDARYGDAKVLVGGGDGAGNLNLYVEGWSYTNVDGCAHTHVKEEAYVDVDGGIALNSDNLTAEIGRDVIWDVGTDYSVRAGSIVLGAPTITLKGAGGFVKIDASGVTIVGNVVNINSGGSAGDATALTQGHATDAEKAGPKEPVAADNAKTGQKSC